jgi:hypothetical protein
VWKFRNLGFADMLYAPVVDTGAEAIAENKMCNVDEGSEEKKSYRYTVANFEDLISEAYVVFTELKNQFESMGIYCDTCQSKCDFYFQMQTVNFEQALVQKLQAHFVDLYRELLAQKRTASIRGLLDTDETVPLELSDSFFQKLHYAYYHKTLPMNMMKLAKGLLTDSIGEGKKGEITKYSIHKYLQKNGWSQKKIQEFFASLFV